MFASSFSGHIMNLEEKRKAIEHGLMPFLTDEYLQRALQLWENNYASQPTFALQKFIGEVCTNKTLAAQRIKILQSVIRALSEPIPKAHAEIGDHSRDKTSAEELLIFMSLIDKLLAQCKNNDAVKVRLFMVEAIEKSAIPIFLQRTLRAWISQLYPLKDIAVDIHTRQQLVNTTYVALCEYYGPIEADSMLHTAMHHVSQAYPRQRVQQLL
jgi:hypothetical protein